MPPESVPFHRLHLQRAGDLFRIRPGFGGGRPCGGREERGHQRRLYSGGATETVVRSRGRDQDRSQGLLREVLQRGRERRSEEHTSELQSLRHLVCRLLLDPAPTEIYPLSLHDALPISETVVRSRGRDQDRSQGLLREVLQRGRER